MDINVIVTGGLLVLSFFACLIAARIIEKAREHRAEAAAMLAEARALNAARPDVYGTPVPVDSPEGQAILAAIRRAAGEPCPCPNCEETRRIAHADQKRDER